MIISSIGIEVRRLAAIIVIAVGASLLVQLPVHADLLEPTPAVTRNPHPFIRIFGLPTPGFVSPVDRGRLGMSLQLTSFSKQSNRSNETLTLDGEAYGANLLWQQRVGDRFSFDAEVPFLYDSGGFMDNTIDTWHDILGVDIRSRDEAPSDRLLHRYEDPEGRVALIDNSGGGIGDARVSARWHINGQKTTGSLFALRAGVKLPTGDEDDFRGSGATDYFVALEAAWLTPVFGRARFHSSVGWLEIGDADNDALSELQRDGVMFGHITTTIQLTDNWQLLGQLDGHGSFYRGAITAMAEESMQLVVGTRWGFAGDYVGEFMVVEDPISDTSPDFTFQLGFYRRY